MIDTHKWAIAVEGKTDVAILQQFLNIPIIPLNGSAVDQHAVDYLKKLQASGYQLLVFTDPDYPGEAIRHTLNTHIQGLHHVYIDKKKAIKNGKVGVAETAIEDLKAALEHIIPNQSMMTSTLTMDDVITCKLTGCDEASSRRQKVAHHFHLGQPNTKSLLKRLQSIGVTRAQLEEVLK
jgi:ribonuclease M5